MRIPRLLLFMLLGVMLSPVSYAQHTHGEGEPCGTVQLRKYHISEQSYQQEINAFEKWMAEKRKARAHQRIEEDVLTIPVVVHVIHNGQPVGEGPNITDAQIIDHLASVTEDYRATNPELNSIPSEFQDDIADVKFEFCLAQRDPEGLPTTGIIRVNGGRASWTYNDDRALKAQSYWPAEDYINIWVTELGGGLAGYAQPPETELPGWEGFGRFDRLTDGIVVDHAVFLRGARRTTSHELGHYFSLRHIWGDGDCRADDYCEDTPESDAPNRGCDQAHESCNSLDMVANFMDYSACRHFFTNDQKERMRIVMENSPRRLSLLSSPACEAPIVTAYNAGIRAATSPNLRCAHEFAATVDLRNYGTENLTEVQIGYRLDDQVVENFYTWTGNLAQYDIEQIQLPGFMLPAGFHRIEFFTTMPNGEEDGDPTNDEHIQEFIVVDREPVALQDFEGGVWPPSDNWIIDNPDGSYTWRDTLLTYGNHAVCIDFANYSSVGQTDRLNSPLWNLAGMENPTLFFKVAYARATQGGDLVGESDALRITASNNCGRVNIPLKTISRDELATMPDFAMSDEANSSAPSSDSDWRTERLSLARFQGEEIIVSFWGINGYGNVLWLDDIEITNLTSLEDFENFKARFEVFPNPTTDGRMNLRLHESLDGLQLEVSDLSGRSLWKKQFEHTQAGQTLTFTLPETARGLLLLRLTSTQGEIIQKIMVE